MPALVEASRPRDPREAAADDDFARFAPFGWPDLDPERLRSAVDGAVARGRLADVVTVLTHDIRRRNPGLRHPEARGHARTLALTVLRPGAEGEVDVEVRHGVAWGLESHEVAERLRSRGVVADIAVIAALMEEIRRAWESAEKRERKFLADAAAAKIPADEARRAACRLRGEVITMARYRWREAFGWRYVEDFRAANERAVSLLLDQVSRSLQPVPPSVLLPPVNLNGSHRSRPRQRKTPATRRSNRGDEDPASGDDDPPSPPSGQRGGATTGRKRPGPVYEDATRFLLGIGGSGATGRSAPILAEGWERGLHPRVVREAARRLGISSRRVGFGPGGYWLWTWPRDVLVTGDIETVRLPGEDELALADRHRRAVLHNRDVVRFLAARERLRQSPAGRREVA